MSRSTASIPRASFGYAISCDRWRTRDEPFWSQANLDGLLARAGGVALNETGGPGGPGTVRVATVEDLLAIAQHSPWSEDALYKAGLRAVLASSHYRAARPPCSLAL